MLKLLPITFSLIRLITSLLPVIGQKTPATFSQNRTTAASHLHGYQRGSRFSIRDGCGGVAVCERAGVAGMVAGRMGGCCDRGAVGVVDCGGVGDADCGDAGDADCGFDGVAFFFVFAFPDSWRYKRSCRSRYRKAVVPTKSSVTSSPDALVK